jgi:DNA-binding response OmpR family regulator
MFAALGAELMLVEGEPTMAELTSFRLELLGFRMRHVNSLTAAQQELERDLPDLMIINSALPDGDGLEFVSRLRNHHSPADLPVLVCTTDNQLGTVERAYRCGVQAYIVAPFDPTVLESKIQELLLQDQRQTKTEHSA